MIEEPKRLTILEQIEAIPFKDRTEYEHDKYWREMERKERHRIQLSNDSLEYGNQGKAIVIGIVLAIVGALILTM